MGRKLWNTRSFFNGLHFAAREIGGRLSPESIARN